MLYDSNYPGPCTCCHLPFGGGDKRELIGEYDEIEIPRVRPLVRRHRRFSIRCACCGDHVRALVRRREGNSIWTAQARAMSLSIAASTYPTYRRKHNPPVDRTNVQGAEGYDRLSISLYRPCDRAPRPCSVASMTADRLPGTNLPAPLQARHLSRRASAFHRFRFWLS